MIRVLKVQVKGGIKIAPPDGSIREEQTLGHCIILEAIKVNFNIVVTLQ